MEKSNKNKRIRKIRTRKRTRRGIKTKVVWTKRGRWKRG
jgi:hypothetical protein